MSNAPDYENDLVFKPKSADDLNRHKRLSDVLIFAIERREKLEKKLEIAVKALEEYANQDNWTNCLTFEDTNIVDLGLYGYYGFTEAQEALAKIKELDK